MKHTWLGQPAQAADFPALSEAVPGQCSGGGAANSVLIFHYATALQYQLSIREKWSDVATSKASKQYFTEDGKREIR